MTDRIEWVGLSLLVLPLATPISDAKVLTGRQKPLTEIAFLFAEIPRGRPRGHRLLLQQARRRPGQYAHAKEIAPALIGEDPNDIARLWEKLCGPAPASAAAAWPRRPSRAFDIALWDLKAKRAGLPLAKLLGAHRDCVQCYNTSGGFLHTPLPRCWRTSRSRSSAASAASRSRSASPTRWST